MHILVKDLAVCERPYEKAERYGVSALSDAELLSLIMRTGTKEASVLDLANQVLNAHDTQKGLLGLQFLLPQELTKIPGVGKVKAIQLLALAEISKRMNLEQLQKKLEFHTPDTIGAYYREKCRFLSVEKNFFIVTYKCAYFNQGSGVILWHGQSDLPVTTRDIYSRAAL